MPELTGEIRNDKGQFVKGVTGNPEGRPKGSYSIVEMIRNKLKEIPEGKDKTYGEYFIEQIMKKTVVDGDVTMMRDVINRIDGMPKQHIDSTINLSVETDVTPTEAAIVEDFENKLKESI